MQIYIDFSYFNYLSSLTAPQLMWQLFLDGGWIIFVGFLVYALWNQWLLVRQTKWAAKVDYVLLAVDVPKDNEQSPKAVEHLMTNLAGAHTPFSKWEEWWDGAIQLSFSLEIVSIEGYIQFLVRTPDYWRDMVEAAIYAQYPEAEITEVEDYVNVIPDKYPDEKWKFYGTELVPVKPDAYPLRTYIEFEHSMSQELKDPLAALLEIFSRLGQGEQMWFQIIVIPTDDSWKDRAEKEVKKLTGQKVEEKKSAIDKAVDPFMQIGSEFYSQITGLEPGESKSDDKNDQFKMLNMSPGARRVLEKVEYKMSKLGFYAKIRIAYVGKAENFNKAKRVGTIFSAVKQYNSLDCNALKPGKASTRALYLFAKQRVIAKTNRFVRAYKNRSHWMGTDPFILNIEELATLYHFPAIDIKVPMLKKTTAKKGEPPTSLPFNNDLPLDEVGADNNQNPKQTDNENNQPEQQINKKVGYLPESLKNYNFDNKHFEQRFAKNDKINKSDNKEAKAQSEDNIPNQGQDEEPPINLPLA